MFASKRCWKKCSIATIRIFSLGIFSYIWKYFILPKIYIHPPFLVWLEQREITIKFITNWLLLYLIIGRYLDYLNIDFFYRKYFVYIFDICPRYFWRFWRCYILIYFNIFFSSLIWPLYFEEEVLFIIIWFSTFRWNIALSKDK